MAYNVCIIQPHGDYVHSGAFLELAELVWHGLQDIGLDATIGLHHVDPKRTNILIGCHLVDPALAAELPASTIILNTEQLDEGGNEIVQATLQHWISRFETWDYSRRNIACIAGRHGRQAKFLQLGFHPKLHRIPRVATQDIDVLFYGSRNERRRRIHQALRQAGLRVESVFGVYGPRRDALIARSKVVLNMHFYDSRIFEIVRVFYLMTNSKAVVTEVEPETAIDDQYRAGLATAPYDGLIEACRALINDDAGRAELEKRALDTIQDFPQGPIMAELVGRRTAKRLGSVPR